MSEPSPNSGENANYPKSPDPALAAAPNLAAQDPGPRGDARLEAIKTLKTPIQLAGFVVFLVVTFLGFLTSPPNPVILGIGGAIGVSLVVFALVLSNLDPIPAAQRVRLILATYVTFGLILTASIVLSIWFYIATKTQLSKGRAQELSVRMHTEIGKLQRQIQLSDTNLAILQYKLIRAEGAPKSMRDNLESQRIELAGKLGETQERHKRLLGLYNELSNPNSKLAQILEDSSAALSVEQQNEILRTGTLEEIRKRQENSEVKETAKKSLYTAWLYYLDGNFPTARSWFLAVLTVEPENIEALQGLGELEAVLGNYSKAASYFDRLIAVYKSTPLQSKGQIIFALANRVTMARFEGDFAVADRFCKEAEKLLTSDFQERDHYFALAANDLGWHYFLTGQFGQAEAIFNESVNYYKGFKSIQYGYSDILNNFGAFCRCKEDYVRSEKLLADGIAIMEQSKAQGSFGYAILLYNLGATQRLAGKLEESKKSLQSAKLILQRVEASDDRLARVNFEIALLDLDTTAKPEGLQAAQAAIDQMTKAHSPTYYRVIEMIARLSEAYRFCGCNDAAGKLFASELGRDALQKLPAFVRDSYDAERVLTDALLRKSSPEDIMIRAKILDESFNSYGTPLPRLRLKLQIAQIFAQTSSGNRNVAKHLYDTFRVGSSSVASFESRAINSLKEQLFSKETLPN